MRRGFTLVEMLVAMVVVGIVGAALIRLLSNQQRVSVTQVEQAMLQSNVRVGTQVLASELQEMGSDVDSVDLVTANASSVTYRAMRTLGFACSVTSSQVKIRTDRLYGTRLPVAGQDNLLLFVEKVAGIPDHLGDGRELRRGGGGHHPGHVAGQRVQRGRPGRGAGTDLRNHGDCSGDPRWG